MAIERPLISIRALFEEGDDTLSALVRKMKGAKALPKEKPKTQADDPKSLRLSQLAKKAVDADPAHDTTKTPKELITPQERPAGQEDPVKMAPDPEGDIWAGMEHPPGKFDAWDAEGDTHSEQHRPDLNHPEVRHNNFHEAWHDPENLHTDMRHLGGGGDANTINHAFKGKRLDGSEYVAKPHAGADGMHDPKTWGQYHQAAYRMLSGMGYSHMMTPAVTANMPAEEHVPSSHKRISDLTPSERGKEEEGRYNQLKSAHDFAGKPAFVTEYAPDTQHVSNMSAEDTERGLAGDKGHRLAGALTHLLMNNSDGHFENVMMHQKTGHPVLIDLDGSLSNAQGKNREGYGSTRSVFLPGGKLDYRGQDKEQVGTNFPPRVQKHLEWLAKGGHTHPEHGYGLSDKDSQLIQGTANSLITDGMEATLRNRPIYGWNKGADEIMYDDGVMHGYGGAGYGHAFDWKDKSDFETPKLPPASDEPSPGTAATAPSPAAAPSGATTPAPEER